MKPNTFPRSRRAIIDDLADLLHGFDRHDLSGAVAFGTADRDEIQLRETGAIFMLLLLHSVDDRGRCRYCRPARRSKRRWPRWPHRKAPCQVLKVIGYFSSKPLDEVWLPLLPRLGIRRELDKIRANLANHAAATDFGATAPIPVQVDHTGRHALRGNDITA